MPVLEYLALRRGFIYLGRKFVKNHNRIHFWGRFYFIFHFRRGAGLAVGLSGLAAGFAIGIVGDAGVRGTTQQPRLFVGMILILIFAEVSQGSSWE